MDARKPRSMKALQKLVTSGFDEWGRFGDVTTKTDGDLILFNYAKKAVFRGRWNWFERVSRGLILNRQTGEVVARPFDKFFNWGEGGRMTSHELVEVTEKIDGSMGILYRDGGEYRIATRGSFNSAQAEWATEFLHANYDLRHLPNEFTLLFEIIAPWDRKVVDYGGREDLVLIGVRHRYNGDDFLFDTMKKIASHFGFGLPLNFTGYTVKELLVMRDILTSNNEGWVCRFADGQRFKIKGQQYLELHRLLSDITYNRVVDVMANEKITEWLGTIPEEFREQAEQWAAEIEAKVHNILGDVKQNYLNAPKASRKEFAMWVNKNCPHLASYMFLMLDGVDPTELIFKREF